jgi:hypothetical protein
VRSDKLDGLLHDLRLRPLGVARFSGSWQDGRELVEERVEAASPVLLPDLELGRTETAAAKRSQIGPEFGPQRPDF